MERRKARGNAAAKPRKRPARAGAPANIHEALGMSPEQVEAALAAEGVSAAEAARRMRGAIAEAGAQPFLLDGGARGARVSGSAMAAIGIEDGDTVSYDEARRGQAGDLVLVSRDGQRFEVRALTQSGSKSFLHAEDPGVPDEEVGEACPMKIRGVVTGHGKRAP